MGAKLLAALVLAVPLAAQAAMGWDDARHLLNRAGFGARPAEIAEYAALTREQAVERLLAGLQAQARTPPPQWVSEPIVPPRRLRAMAPEERKAFIARERRRGLELRAWWLAEMLDTPSPLTERMTLFWHNHFVSSQQKVRYSQLMYRQNLLLRRHGAGGFGELLHAAAKDPAMVIYLDAASNRKGQPNENFAREVMELFTLGEGRYSEADVREAARAFTGWSLDRQSGEFKWRPALHDGGEKTVFGRTGRFDGDAVLELLLEQPHTGEYLAAKLWREFVSPEPQADEVARIAARFRASGYDIRTALREIFLSGAFWAAPQRAALVKSPVDLVVGTLRALELQVEDAAPLAIAVAHLGQNLFSPPGVKGWPGGTAWINSSTLLARKGFAERLLRADEMPGPAMARIRFEPQRWLAQLPGREGEAGEGAAAMQRALLAREPVQPLPSGLPAREALRRIALDPAFQLK